MYRFVVFALALSVAGLVGCATMTTKGPVTALIVQQSEPLDVDGTYETHNVIRINVRYGKVEWTAYVGPNPGQDEPVRVTLTQSSAPALLVVQGWVFISGQWPTGRTRRVVGGASGTDMLVQHEGPADAGIHRVFYMGGNWPTVIDVTLDGNSDTTKPLSRVRTYFEVGPEDEEIPPSISNKDAPPNVQALLDHVDAMVETADLD